MKTLESKLQKRRLKGNLRHLSSPKELIDFASNDSLGLAKLPAFNRAVVKEWWSCQKLGSSGSRLLMGNSIYLQNLEDRIAKFHESQTGTLFNCGYTANLGLLTAILSPEDRILYDIDVHASIHDGIRLSHARALPFRHNDLCSLETRLKRSHGEKNTFVCIESIYSLDGSKAPLREICQLCHLYNAYLIVDEAHATGVWGPQGRGLVEENELENKIFARIITFGKALGVQGAIVLGNLLLRKILVNFARPFIYSTAPAYPLLAAIKWSYEFFPKMDKERQQIQNLIQFFSQFSSQASTTHIQSIKIKGNFAVRQIAHQLTLRGFDIRPLMSPTVRQGKEILRICLHAFNTTDQVEEVLGILKKMGVEF